MNDLMVIDDRALRKSAFGETAKILKKIERLEASVETFHREEQDLFREWEAVTFRAEHQRLRDLSAAYDRLVDVHNELVAIARFHDCDLVEAWIRLERENKKMAKADQAGRERIVNERIQRAKALHEEIRREEAEEDAANDETDDFLRGVESMTDAQLRNLGRDGEFAHRLLWRVMMAAELQTDYLLAFRVWSFIAPRDQASFNKQFIQRYGQPFLEFLADMGPDNFDFGSQPEEKSPLPPPEPPRPSSGENIKLLYRQLVRKLHPDRGGEAATPAHWQNSVWSRVQGAYQKQSLAELKKLWTLVLVRTGELSQLSMSEILASRDELRAELDGLGRAMRQYKKSPAWGFSKRKTYAALEKKLKKPMLKQIARIEGELFELRAEHFQLAQIARQMRARRTSGGPRGYGQANLFD